MKISDSRRFHSFRCCPRPNVGQSQGATKISNYTRMGNGVSAATTSNVQIWKELDPAARDSDTFPRAQSLTQSLVDLPHRLAPPLRHSHRNASAARVQSGKHGCEEENQGIPAPCTGSSLSRALESWRRGPREGHQALPHHSWSSSPHSCF